MTTKVPFKEGLYTEISGEALLIASKCVTCGQVFFPKKSLCLNCMGIDLNTIHLGSHGTLYSYSTVHMNSEHFQAPYTVGWIELPEGIRIFSQIRGWQVQSLKTGMDMRLSIERLWQTEDNDVMGHVFRPADMPDEDN